MKNQGSGGINFFSLGSRVLVGEKTQVPGTLRFLGAVHFVEGVWCGVELDEEEGLHDGLVQDVRYFTCPPRKGVFAPLSKLRPLSANNNTFRSTNHGVLFDCPFETTVSTITEPNKMSRLPRPTYFAIGKFADTSEDSKSFEAEHFVNEKGNGNLIKKSTTSKKVTFDMEPEFLDDDELEIKWKKSRSENDSLLRFGMERENNNNSNNNNNNNCEKTRNSAELNSMYYNSLRRRHDTKKEMKHHPEKFVSLSLDAVESDLNDLLLKIDKEISNVKTPDTAEMSNIIPDFFPEENQNIKSKRENENRVQPQIDEAVMISIEEAGKLQVKHLDDESNNDITILTGSPSFRLAQTAMVQYAELLKASQAGLVAQKSRYQNEQPFRIVRSMSSSTSDGFCRNSENKEIASVDKQKVERENSESIKSSTEDLYEIFEGEDLPTLKTLPEDEPLISDTKRCHYSKKKKDTDDVCNFLDSLLKSGQELEKWLEISVAADDQCPDKTVTSLFKEEENILSTYTNESTALLNQENSEDAWNKIIDSVLNSTDLSKKSMNVLSDSINIFEMSSKDRPLSYVSTADSNDTGCPMEFDCDDLMKSFNLETSLINIDATSDSLLLEESWSDIFKNEVDLQDLNLIEKSVPDNLDSDVNESIADDPVSADILINDRLMNLNYCPQNLIAPYFVSLNEAQENNSPTLFSDATEMANRNLTNFDKEKLEGNSANQLLLNEEIDILLDFGSNPNQGSTEDCVPNLIEDAISDSQKANASGLSSTPSSSFSSFCSSQKDQNFSMMHDVLQENEFFEVNQNQESVGNLGVDSNDAIQTSELLVTKSAEVQPNAPKIEQLLNNENLEKKVVKNQCVSNNDNVQQIQQKSHAATFSPCESLEREIINERKITCGLKTQISKIEKNFENQPSKFKVNSKLEIASQKKSEPNSNTSCKVLTSFGQAAKSHVNNSFKQTKTKTQPPNMTDSQSSSITSDASTKKASTPFKDSNLSKLNFAKHVPVAAISAPKTVSSSLPLQRKEKLIKYGRNLVKEATVDNPSKENCKKIFTEDKKDAKNVDHITKKPSRNVRSNADQQETKVSLKIFTKKLSPSVKIDENSSKNGSSGKKIIQRKTSDVFKPSFKNAEITQKLSSLPIRQNVNVTEKSTKLQKIQLESHKISTYSKAIKNAKNTMSASEVEKSQNGQQKKKPANLLSKSEVNQLTDQLNESMILAEECLKEKCSLEKLMAGNEKQYKERVTKFEKGLEEKLAWLKSDLEIKHKNFVQELTDKHEKELELLQRQCNRKTEDLMKVLDQATEIYEKDIASLREENENTIEELKKKNDENLQKLNTEFEASMKNIEDKISELQIKLDESKCQEKVCLDASRLDRDLRQQALLEIDSLEVVVETKNKELKKLRFQNSCLEEKVQEIPQLKEKLISLIRQVEHLESIIASKTENEKQLLDNQQKLLKRSLDGSEAVRKLSMNNEELMWKLSRSDVGPSMMFESKFLLSPSKSPLSTPSSPSFTGKPINSE